MIKGDYFKSSKPPVLLWAEFVVATDDDALLLDGLSSLQFLTFIEEFSYKWLIYLTEGSVEGNSSYSESFIYIEYSTFI